MLHVVLGDGGMTKKELVETLKDLYTQAGEEPYWFLVQGKSEPSDTDEAMIAWFDKNEIYYEVFTDDADAMAECYSTAQETHPAKKLTVKIVNLMNTRPEEGESADVLALFVSDEPDVEEDRWLYTVLSAVHDAGFTILALNDGLVEVDLSDEGTTAEAEPEAEPTEATPEAPSEDEWTRERLDELELSDLKALAATLGVELPPRTRMNTYIDAILAAQGDKVRDPAMEAPGTPTPEPEPSTNGDAEPGQATQDPIEWAQDIATKLADEIVDAVITKIKILLDKI